MKAEIYINEIENIEKLEKITMLKIQTIIHLEYLLQTALHDTELKAMEYYEIRNKIYATREKIIYSLPKE